MRLCRAFNKQDQCGTGYVECALIATTTTVAASTASTTPVTTTTPTSTMPATPTTTDTPGPDTLCSLPCFGGSKGNCVVNNSVIKPNTVLCFEHRPVESNPSSKCWAGTTECPKTSTTTATSTTTTTTESTTSSSTSQYDLCSKPCTEGVYGPCRTGPGRGGGATCSGPITNGTDRMGSCEGSSGLSGSIVDCRKASYLGAALPAPAGGGEAYTCKVDDCSNYKVNNMDASADGRLKYTRQSYGHCREPQTGICVAYQPNSTDCWPSTVPCAAAEQTCHDVKCEGRGLCSKNLKMSCMGNDATRSHDINTGTCRQLFLGQCPAKSKNCQARTPGGADETATLKSDHRLCCDCAWSDNGPTSGPCQHPVTKLCFDYTATKGTAPFTCLAGTQACTL